jgi:hypothetical protein
MGVLFDRLLVLLLFAGWKDEGGEDLCGGVA